MQSDAHLQYVLEWDRLYHEEMLASKSYPKSILSSYPPNFQDGDPPYLGGSRGARLCSCEFTNVGRTKRGIIRISTERGRVGSSVSSGLHSRRVLLYPCRVLNGRTLRSIPAMGIYGGGNCTINPGMDAWLEHLRSTV